MPVIGTLVGTIGAREEISRQLARVGEVALLDGAASAVERAEAGRIDALIAELGDGRRGSIARTIAILAARAPRLPVVIFDRLDRGSVQALSSALVPGLQIRCVLRPQEPLAPVVRQVLTPMVPPPVAPVLVQRFLRAAPPYLHVFLAIAALKAPSRRGLDQLARWSGVTPRTIERRLHRAHWAPARAILQCARALDVLWLMTEYGWTVRRVQAARGFAYPSAITRLTHRYCGVSPAEVKEGIDFRRVLDDSVQRLAAGRST